MDDIRITDSELNAKCRFCYPPDQDRILYQSEHFYVMLTLGPLVEGYLLLISKDHIDCCGAFEGRVEADFLNQKELIREILLSTYGKCLFFEHGRAGSCINFDESSRHCHHAHLHCLPINMNLHQSVKGALKPVYFEKGQFQSTYRHWNEPYLYIDDGKEGLHFLAKKPQRQYLRYLVAKHLGDAKKADWNTFQAWDLIYSAKEKLQHKFREGVLYNY